MHFTSISGSYGLLKERHYNAQLRAASMAGSSGASIVAKLMSTGQHENGIEFVWDNQELFALNYYE
jgi:hypothetical protein